MHLIAAHMAGTGKSYLVDTFAMVATGRLCPVITALKNVEETEKRLGSIVLSGIPMVSLDNSTHDLGGIRQLCRVFDHGAQPPDLAGRAGPGGEHRHARGRPSRAG